MVSALPPCVAGNVGRVRLAVAKRLSDASSRELGALDARRAYSQTPRARNKSLLSARPGRHLFRPTPRMIGENNLHNAKASQCSLSRPG